MSAGDRREGSLRGAAVGVATGAVGSVAKGIGNLIETALRAPASIVRLGARRVRPGAAPGIEHLPDIHEPPPPEAVRIRCIDYGPASFQDVAVVDLDRFLDTPRPEGAAVRWVDVEGLNPFVVNRFRERYGFHTLAAEDVLHVPQRPKAEAFADHVFVAGQMLSFEDGRLAAEQVSFFLFDGLLLTFQERQGDVWEPVRGRLQTDGSRVRERDSSYLLYALLDAVVDHCFPLLERYGDALEDLEDALVERPGPDELQRLHGAKRELTQIRRILWPTRDMVAALGRNEDGRLSDLTLTYLRDVNDHANQLIDIVETYREMASGLNDLYMSAISNRMNEVMKVLTIIATIFIPITFVAGVYGMNFEHMPELAQEWAYPAFWGVCVTIALGLVIYFRRRGWLGGRQLGGRQLDGREEPRE